jgi:signal transduction histidine kinase
MKLYFKRGVVSGFIITLLMIGGLGIYSYISVRKLIDVGGVQSSSLKVINYAERLLVTTIDLETGQRGFLITGDSSYLEPYADALRAIDENIKLLASATAGNRQTRELVTKLKQLVAYKAAVAARTVQARLNSFEAARDIVVTNEGKMVMDQIRSVIDQIKELENTTYNKETQSAAKRLDVFQYAFTGALVVPAVIVVVLFYTINNNLTRKEIASQELQRANLEINQLNKDLESFSYSVSHDLRAPLRSVNGYANILIEDYGDQLDEEAKKTIGIIARNGKRMGQLIDDLLHFSRLGRKEVQRTNVAMREMVDAVIVEIRETKYFNSKTIIDVKPLPDAIGDVNMLRMVWHNLIANALKYSSKNEEARVEVGAFEKDGNLCYYVKDNGVGFDMQYVGKLFGVFQRLHKQEEFEGTGVGLALAKRIIERHSGTIWAEGALNNGATFYFSLPS